MVLGGLALELQPYLCMKLMLEGFVHVFIVFGWWALVCRNSSSNEMKLLNCERHALNVKTTLVCQSSYMWPKLSLNITHRQSQWIITRRHWRGQTEQDVPSDHQHIPHLVWLGMIDMKGTNVDNSGTSLFSLNVKFKKSKKEKQLKAQINTAKWNTVV